MIAAVDEAGPSLNWLCAGYAPNHDDRCDRTVYNSRNGLRAAGTRTGFGPGRPADGIYPTLPCVVAAYENGEIAEANQIVELL